VTLLAAELWRLRQISIDGRYTIPAARVQTDVRTDTLIIIIRESRCKILLSVNALGAISAGVEMSLVSARRQLLMLIAGYAQGVSSRLKDRRNRTQVDHSCSSVT